ncbi:MAG: hypothetical protein ABFQ89_06915, partial [Chloroflexota bacterium]
MTRRCLRIDHEPIALIGHDGFLRGLCRVTATSTHSLLFTAGDLRRYVSEGRWGLSLKWRHYWSMAII